MVILQALLFADLQRIDECIHRQKIHNLKKDIAIWSHKMQQWNSLPSKNHL